jgi:hypothetical protein
VKVNYGRDFTDDQLRAIAGGGKRKATRKEVKAWMDNIIEGTLNEPRKAELGNVGCGTTDNGSYHRPAAPPVLLTKVGEVCTPLDHVFPLRCEPPAKGTECYCGQRKW